MRFQSRREYIHPAQDEAEDLKGFEAEYGPVPKRKVLCPQCRGTGRSCLYLGSYTQSEMDEQGPDFYEDYMSGAYDRTCDTCGGANVVDEANEDAMSVEMLEEWMDWVQDAYSYRAECEAERRMGA